MRRLHTKSLRLFMAALPAKDKGMTLGRPPVYRLTDFEALAAPDTSSRLNAEEGSQKLLAAIREYARKHHPRVKL
jgi:hypothetical protein